MIQMRFNQAASILGCKPLDEDIRFHGITTDSRKIVSGMLFAALTGKTFDGHDYARQAKELGAVALLVSRDVDADLPVLQVDDVLKALGKLAAAWRMQCPARVVGITGSNGKTTVKEMVAGVLSQSARVLATSGNFNNELGLPLTLFELDYSHDYAVLEMGANKPGDIAYLGAIAKPEVALVNNVGPAHLKGFIDLEGVAKAKGEIYAALPGDGTAVINRGQAWVDLWEGMNPAQNVIYFNGDRKGDIHTRMDDDKCMVVTPEGEFELRLSLPGRHNIENALAATAICLALGVSPAGIGSGLAKVRAVPGRLNLVQALSGWTVIDDTYNANPASLYAALQVLSTLSGEPWLVLGDMKEMGIDSHKIHAEVGDAARSLGVKKLFALGEASASTVSAFGSEAQHFEDKETLIRVLREQLRPGVACLVKGSRSMGMEQVVEAISNGSEYVEANS
jgi:UDP-N-acetylmuramoyl-tripeptide--D-alanyl-D-alanine ligase